MANAQLYQYFKDGGHTLSEVAHKTRYEYTYIVALLNGTKPLTDAARLRFVEAFPETARFLLPQAVINELTKAA